MVKPPTLGVLQRTRRIPTSVPLELASSRQERRQVVARTASRMPNTSFSDEAQNDRIAMTIRTMFVDHKTSYNMLCRFIHSHVRRPCRPGKTERFQNAAQHRPGPNVIQPEPGPHGSQRGCRRSLDRSGSDSWTRRAGCGKRRTSRSARSPQAVCSSNHPRS